MNNQKLVEQNKLRNFVNFVITNVYMCVNEIQKYLIGSQASAHFFLLFVY